jgi:hypothetical protein
MELTPELEARIITFAQSGRKIHFMYVRQKLISAEINKVSQNIVCKTGTMRDILFGLAYTFQVWIC